MKTTHGYHIPGTMEDEPEDRKSRHDCGGPNNDCKTCTRDIATYKMREAVVETASLKVKAERLITEHIRDRFAEMDLAAVEFKVETILFHRDKISQDWVIFLAVSNDDSLLYKVSYKASSELTRIAAYALVEEEHITDY